MTYIVVSGSYCIPLCGCNGTLACSGANADNLMARDWMTGATSLVHLHRMRNRLSPYHGAIFRIEIVNGSVLQ